MFSVTRRIKQVKQPYGGYLPQKNMDKVDLDSTTDLNPSENISPALIGLAVDYLSRYMLEGDAVSAFEISLKGAFLSGYKDKAIFYLSNIKGLDDLSIACACKLVGFDSCYRAGIPYMEVPDADLDTVENVRELVNRSLHFFEEYGPITEHGFTFEGAYTDTVSSGDGDFLTGNTLWDFKVLKGPPKKEHTLQLLMYYLMGKESGKEIFKGIDTVGIFNPRLNRVYTYKVDELSNEVIEEIKNEVIGYKD